MQGEIFVVRNFVNTPDGLRAYVAWQCMVTSSVDVFITTFFQFRVQLQIDLVPLIALEKHVGYPNHYHALRLSPVKFYKDTCSHKPTIYKAPSPNMQSHNMVAVALS